MSGRKDQAGLKAGGRAWVFGDNVDTDQISPGKVLTLPLEEQIKSVFETLRPQFREQVRPGDVIVAGSNFGCGSSREHAPEVLKALKVGAVVAESFGRIFFRNAIAIGLPVLQAPSVCASISDGDQLEVDLEPARVINRSSGAILQAQALDPVLLEILKAGGIIQKLRQELGD